MSGSKMQKTTLICLAIMVPALFSTISVASASTRKSSWTFMVYLDADNNLDMFGPINLEQMKQGLTPHAEITVVVLMDRLNLPAYTYEVTHEEIRTVQSLGEINMGAQETLTSFTQFAMQKYPAERYLLILWDHGGGYRGVCWDDSSGDNLTPHEIHLALSAVESRSRNRIQVVGFDACLMAMTEVAYELKDVTDIMLASETLIPGLGWPYQHIMVYLSANPDADAYSLSEEIANSYVSYYPKYTVQLSAVDESKVSTLTDSLDDFTEALEQNMDAYHGVIASARSAAEQKYILGTNGAYFYTDLYKFTYLIGQKVSDSAVSALSQRVLENLEAVVFAESHNNKLDGEEYGLTINFPPNINAYSSRYETYVQCFTEETAWLSSLMAYYA